MFAVAALLAPVTLVVPHGPGYDEAGILAVTAIAAGIAIALLATPRPPTGAMVHAIVAAGTLLVGAVIRFTDGLPNAATLFFVWIVLYAFYFFGLAAAMAHLALVLAIYVALALWTDAPYPLAAHTIATAGTLVGSGVLVAALKRRIEDLLAALVATARTDELTGLPNRRAFNEGLERELARALRTRTPLTLAMLDVDNFKSVNDRLGHPEGDAVLAELSGVLRRSIREIDMPARVGGEEFAALLSATDAGGGEVIAERMRESVRSAFAGHPVPITASIGLATTTPDDPLPATELMRRADRALYTAKENGRDRVERYSEAPASLPSP